MNDDLSFSTEIEVHTADVQREAMLANMVGTYRIVDALGEAVMNGTVEVRGTTMTVAGFAPYDGVLEVMLNTSVPTFYTPGMGFSVPFEASPVVDTNETNGSETNVTGETNTTTEGPNFPDVTLPATVDCTTTTYSWESNASDATITCTVTNPNPFETSVEFAWRNAPVTPPSMEMVWNEATGPSVTVGANNSVDLTFSLSRNAPIEGMFPGLQGEAYIITLTCLDSNDGACATMTQPTATTEGELRWTLGEAPEDTTGPQTNAEDDEASSAMTPVVVGVGVFAAIAALVGGVLVMRRRGDDFDDDEDEDGDYMDGFPHRETMGQKRWTSHPPVRWRISRTKGAIFTKTLQRVLTLPTCSATPPMRLCLALRMPSRTSTTKARTTARTTASPLTRTARNGGKTKTARGGTVKTAGKIGLFGKNDASVTLLTIPENRQNEVGHWTPTCKPIPWCSTRTLTQPPEAWPFAGSRRQAWLA